jgi:hypothetical protein
LSDSSQPVSEEIIKPIDWESALRAITRCRGEVLDNIDRGFLQYQNQSFTLSKVDRICTILVNLLCKKGGHLIISYPVAQFRALPILALEAMYAHPAREKRPLTVCVTRDPWHRDEFMNLCFTGYSTPIHKMCFPVGMLRAGGRVRVLSDGGKPHLVHRPYLVFSPTSQLPDHLGQMTSTLIVEVDHRITPEDVKELRTWSMRNNVPSLLFIVTDPLSQQAKELLGSGIAVWRWDRDSLSVSTLIAPQFGTRITSAPFSPPDRWIRNIADGQDYLIIPVQDEKICPRLIEARQYCLELYKAAQSSKSALLQEAAMRTLNALHSIEDLPSPASYYDREAELIWGTVSMKTRLASLGRMVEEIQRSNPHSAGLLSGTIDRLRATYESIATDHSGKPVVILESIRLALKQRAPLWVVVGNRASKQALQAFIYSRGLDPKRLLENNIHVVTPKELEQSDYCGTLLFVSLPRRDHRVLILYPGSRKLALLAYPGEMPAIEHVLKKELPEIDAFASFEKRKEAICSIAGVDAKDVEKSVQRQATTITEARNIIYLRPQQATVEGLEVEPMLKGIIGNELIIPDLTEWDEGQYWVDDEFPKIDEASSVLTVKFESGKTLLVKPSSHVTVYKESTDSVNDTTASELVPGDLVVLVNESITRGLLDIILERVHRHPKMTLVVVYQRAWIEALRKGMDRFGDSPKTLLQKMIANGSEISTPLTIHLWRMGLILGPQDREDIKRLGLIYNDEMLVTHTNEIYNAVQRVRRIHRQLARRLRHLIKRTGISWKLLVMQT